MKLPNQIQGINRNRFTISMPGADGIYPSIFSCDLEFYDPEVGGCGYGPNESTCYSHQWFGGPCACFTGKCTVGFGFHGDVLITPRSRESAQLVQSMLPLFSLQEPRGSKFCTRST